LQDSGLLDEDSVVEFGLNAGVQYIVTGSIDYISHDYRNYRSVSDTAFNLAAYSRDTKDSLLFATVAIASLLASGTSIETKVTVKIIDVETSQVVFSKSVSGEESLSSVHKTTQNQIIEVSKKAIATSLNGLKKSIANFFTKKGYITKMRVNKDNELIAQINLGLNDKIKQDDVFDIYKLEENIDPLTQKKSCDKVKSKYSLVVSDIISSNNAWGKIDIKDYSKIKILDMVQSYND
jgi:ribosomal protein S8